MLIQNVLTYIQVSNPKMEKARHENFIKIIKKVEKMIFFNLQSIGEWLQNTIKCLKGSAHMNIEICDQNQINLQGITKRPLAYLS